jgi:hypothetical protein
MRRFGVFRLVREVTPLRCPTLLWTPLWCSTLLWTPLWRPVLVRTACRRRVAAETRRPASGRRAWMETALRRAAALRLSSPFLSKSSKGA